MIIESENFIEVVGKKVKLLDSVTGFDNIAITTDICKITRNDGKSLSDIVGPEYIDYINSIPNLPLTYSTTFQCENEFHLDNERLFLQGKNFIEMRNKFYKSFRFFAVRLYENKIRSVFYHMDKDTYNSMVNLDYNDIVELIIQEDLGYVGNNAKALSKISHMIEHELSAINFRNLNYKLRLDICNALVNLEDFSKFYENLLEFLPKDSSKEIKNILDSINPTRSL